MITKIAVAALSLLGASGATPTPKTALPTHNFRINWLPNKGNAVEARILVDPVANSQSQTQAGWLGIGNTKDAFIQCGWVQWGGVGAPIKGFCQIWLHGYYKTFDMGAVQVGSYVTVGLSTNDKSQWLVWYKKANGTWVVPWMGLRNLYPGVGTYLVATEAQATYQLPKLVEQTRTGNGVWK
jgi:hypothetical protein